MEQRIRAAADWLVHSCIRYPNNGVGRYYRADDDKVAPISTEITGYSADALYLVHTHLGDEKYLNAANAMSRFLVDVAWDEGAKMMPFECAEGRVYSYFFDDGIIARGLLRGFEKTGDVGFREIAFGCAESMAKDFRNGALYAPILEAPSKRSLTQEPHRWSRSSGCYQLKAALAWYELWRLTGEERYRALYSETVAWSIADHIGFLERSDSSGRDRMDRLHPYCYFLEGLLPVVADGGNAEIFRSAIGRIVEVLAAMRTKFLRADVLAQLLRLRLAAERLDILKLDLEAAQQELESLLRFQCGEGDDRIRGSFWFGEEDGMLLRFANPATTVFAIQALILWAERGKTASWSRRSLI